MSTASSERSEALSGGTENPPAAGAKEQLRSPSPAGVFRTSRDVLLFLIAFRIVNALCIKTFFQPDEFFQSLEPAWKIVFGEDSGAWITWEWRHHLRSSIHPYLFAGVYYLSNLIASGLRLSPLTHADLLVVAPKLTQALFAAVGDYYTWKLAGEVYGADSVEAWATLALTVVSPWQWFCSTRTLSNCLETTLTIAALYLWPWQWSEAAGDDNAARKPGSRSSLLCLRICFLFAALACVLRPTNLMVWVCLVAFIVSRNSPRRIWLREQNDLDSAADVYVPLIREIFLCGSVILGVSTLADRVYFGSWTLPPLKFLYFNLAQSLAVHYGKNDWHYYLTQGYPLLLTTALPVALVGLVQALSSRLSEASSRRRRRRQGICRQLAVVCVFMPLVLSLISHKEVRFIYPLLPSLHVLTGPPLAQFFAPAILSSSASRMPRRLTLIFLILVNAAVAYYVSVSHASGPLNVLQYLREQQADLPAKAIADESFSRPSPGSLPYFSVGMTVGFLMPCHSTPWRSHFVFPNINAWALSCEPPINLNETVKATYLDEADQFYEDPASFLRAHMVGGTRHLPGRPSYQTNNPSPSGGSTATTPHDSDQPIRTSEHEWPDYLVFFAQLEPLLQGELRNSAYAECYRTWNTAWHDDWRRKGDMVVWCLDVASQGDWQQQQQQRQRQQQQRGRSVFSWLRGSSSQTEQLRKREKHFDKIVEELKKEAGVDASEGQMGRNKWWPGDLRSLIPSWPEFQWPNSLPLPFPPTLMKRKTIANSWLDSSSWRFSSSSWSSLFSRDRGNDFWRRNWMQLFPTEYRPKKNSAGSTEDDHRNRRLWS